jgi:glycerol kinase
VAARRPRAHLRKSSDVEALAAQVPDNGGVTIVPAFAGLGAPHWDPGARGAIVGVTRGTTAAHLARAALESIAFQTADLIGAMEADSGRSASASCASTAAPRVNDALMQFQSDLIARRSCARG